MKYKILIFPLFYLSYINGYDLSEYEAKYKFESNEISITGIREFKKNQDGYEIRFNASNLIASLFFYEFEGHPIAFANRHVFLFINLT